MSTERTDPSQPTRETAWHVITGPPSAGKSSVLKALADQGHGIVAETARAYLAELHRSPAEIAADADLQHRIQRDIAARQRAVEDDLPAGQPLFLDRALPDSIAYFRRLGLPVAELMARGQRVRYRRVFYLEGLALRRDGLRFEDDGEAAGLGHDLIGAYAALGYAVVQVPAFADLASGAAIARRAALILEHARLDPG